MTEEKGKRIRYALLWSFRFLKKYKLGFIIVILSGTILSAINLSTVIYIERAIEQIAHKKNNIITICIILLCLLAFGTLLTYMTEYISGKIGSCVAYDIRDIFTDKIMKISEKSKDQLRLGDIISRFNYDLGIITDFIPGGITNLVYQMVMAVTAIVYMLYINWLLLSISIAIVPVCMIIVNILRKRISNYFEENIKNIGQANKIASETINNINVIKAYNLQDIIFSNIKKFYNGSLNSWINIHKLFSPMLMLNILMNEFPKVFCIALGSYLALNHYIAIGNLVGFVLLLDYVVNPITKLPDIITSISNTGAAYERIVQIYELKEERDNGTYLADNIKNQVLLEMKNIKFGYNESKTVLDNINLKLKVCEKVALVGKSGCGKSSVIKLLSGFYDYDEGEIYICGKPYHEISLRSIVSI